MTVPRRWHARALLASAIAAIVALPLMPASADESGSPSPAAESAGQKSVFTVGITQDVDSTNPFTGIAAASFEVYQMMYPTLTEYSAADFSTVPGLAESWEESEDRSYWTYKIRPDLKWSDGEPLTARDAAYTFNRVINGDIEQTNYGGYTSTITRAEAPDDTTLVLYVKRPSPIMYQLAVYILPEHIWKDIDAKKVKSFKNEPENGEPVVGGGPYVLIERRKGEYLRFAANPNFYAGKPAADEIVFRVYKNTDAIAEALRKGEVDYANDLSANVFNSLANTDGITTVPSVYSGFNQIAFNMGAALTDGTPIGDGSKLVLDPQVRLAIAQATDRQVLADKVYGGFARPGTTIIPPLYTNLHLEPENQVAFDLDAANATLDAAGYTMGDDGVRTSADGERMSLRLFGRQESSESQKVVEYVKDWLSQIGIEVKVKIVSEDTLYEKVGNGDFDMFEWGWVVEPDPDYQLSTFTCDQRSTDDDGTIFAGLSDSFYCDAEYDKLYQEQKLETDQGKRADIVKAMQQMLFDSNAYVVTVYYDNPTAYRSDRWTNFTPQPEPDGVLLFQYGTWSYQSLEPVSADSGGSTSSSGGVNPALIVVGVLAAVGLVLGGVMIGRRRTSDDDVE
ncbi:MAG: ABC transporter substrate-binding protein [Candidatus Nanopelagicales bacterium]|jgi:peptide/nickel transport system substrate-binding protein